MNHSREVHLQFAAFTIPFRGAIITIYRRVSWFTGLHLGHFSTINFFCLRALRANGARESVRWRANRSGNLDRIQLICRIVVRFFNPVPIILRGGTPVHMDHARAGLYGRFNSNNVSLRAILGRPRRFSLDVFERHRRKVPMKDDAPIKFGNGKCQVVVLQSCLGNLPIPFHLCPVLFRRLWHRISVKFQGSGPFGVRNRPILRRKNGRRRHQGVL